MTTKYVSHEVRDKFFQAQRAVAANKICFDCDRRSPMWATVSFGIFMCLDCSGYHRRLGVHVSFVRSTDMDEWTEDQLLTMQLGGNNEARKFFKQHGVTDMMNIDEKYKTKAATLYKAQLAKKVQIASFDASPYTTVDTSSAASAPGDLDDLVKLVGAGEAVAAPAYTLPPAPVRATATQPKPIEAPATGMLDINRPVVMLGGNASSAAAAPASTLTSKLSSRRTSGSTATKRTSTRLGATKVTSSFDDFDSIPFENPKPSVAAVAASKQIDDDEALARAIQKADEETLSQSLQTTRLAASSAAATEANKTSLDKYKNSKSISSANYFAGEEVDADREKIRQFSGAQAISSDMYYGNGERARSASMDAADEAAYQLDQLKSQVSDKAAKLKTMTSSFFSDLQNRYG